MTTHAEATALVRRMQECFNTRRFDQAEELFTPGFFSHPLGAAGFKTDAWHMVTDRFPGMRVVADEILVDGDKITVRSSVEGTGNPGGDTRPVLIEIFRVEDGRFAENWGSTWVPRIT